eukprot:5254461-Heterocapsa_arctica.AAC.1
MCLCSKTAGVLGIRMSTPRQTPTGVKSQTCASGSPAITRSQAGDVPGGPPAPWACPPRCTPSPRSRAAEGAA